MKHVKIPLTDEELKHVLEYVTPERRKEILISEADRISGKKWRELTSSLSEKNSQALTICPMFIGGDSSDMDTFIVDVYQRQVTDENYKEVAQLFREWYKQNAPGEYHDPEPTWTLREMGYGDWKR